jgi:hypothetical protein
MVRPILRQKGRCNLLLFHQQGPVHDDGIRRWRVLLRKPVLPRGADHCAAGKAELPTGAPAPPPAYLTTAGGCPAMSVRGMLLLDGIQHKHGARQADTCLTDLRSVPNWYASRSDYVPIFTRGMKRSDAKPRDRSIGESNPRNTKPASKGGPCPRGRRRPPRQSASPI